MASRSRRSRLARALRPGWLRLQPAFHVVLIAAGVAYFAWPDVAAGLAEDPCCHVLVPGGGPIAWGVIGLGVRAYRLREFRATLAAAAGRHNLAATERRMRELLVHLPPKYRERWNGHRQEIAGRGR